ncbi:transposase [Archangium sp. Cb G35]|uniref:transposase n=1 Tax=Archangium sp. Cb G35 TaxID=1920190 RepID=UPI0009F8C08C|nr:transposase [Archangium sp. Cb G35]
MERVLPHVPYRQWTLSFPHRVRWVLLKNVGLLSDVLTLFLRAVFALQRRRRRQGLHGGQTGAVSFIQFFGSTLQVTPHFHSLVPDGVFVPEEGGVRFEPLPPPTQGEVEQLLKVVRHRVLRLLEKRGALPAQGPEDALQAYQAHSLQQRLRWTEVDVRHHPRKQPRCTFLEGFSLHANTHLHANDRQGLERLCRYGARGALALERLSRAEDGRITYRMKRPLPDGTTHLLFTGLKLLRRLASLVPPPRANLTRFHGVFAPGAKLRPFLVPQAGAEEASARLEVAARKERMKERTPRVDWAELLKRTFDFDVFVCVRCGGRQRVLAYLTAPNAVRAILEHLALPSQPAKRAPTQGPPQLACC